MGMRSILLAASLTASVSAGCDGTEDGCKPITDCCVACADGPACGDTCYAAGETCDRYAGCACDGDDICYGGGVPMSGSLEYATCVGPRGACGGEDCCIEENDHVVVFDARVSCTVRSSTSGGYRITFSAFDQDEDNGIDGTELEFGGDSSALGLVTSCESFTLRERNNQYPAESCMSRDTRTDELGGGGCEVEARLNSIGIVEGRFTCEELVLPSQELYLSTVGGGGIAAGTFELYGCDLRL
jgi:hypothetical protein